MNGKADTAKLLVWGKGERNGKGSKREKESCMLLFAYRFLFELLLETVTKILGVIDLIK